MSNGNSDFWLKHNEWVALYKILKTNNGRGLYIHCAVHVLCVILIWTEQKAFMCQHTHICNITTRSWKGGFWPGGCSGERESLYLIYCHSLTSAQLECIPQSSLKSGIKGHPGFSLSFICNYSSGKTRAMHQSLSLSFFSLSHTHNFH